MQFRASVHVTTKLAEFHAKSCPAAGYPGGAEPPQRRTRLHRSRSSRGGAWPVRGVGFSTSPEVVSKTANEVSCKRVVSFIVPAHNEEKYLAGTLCALHATAGEVLGEPYEVIVVNDA